jgi:hypothetical protein
VAGRSIGWHLLLPFAVLFDAGSVRGEPPAKAPTAGVLPAAAEPALARAIDEGLDAALGSRDRSILGPRALLARLAARPIVVEDRTRAEELIAEAEEATLRMERPQALERSARAIELLQGIGGQYHAAALLARAHFAAALAALLAPADARAARAAFARGLAIAPTARPDERRLSPRAQRLLSQAQQQGASRGPPATFARRRLCALLALDRLVWVQLGGAQERSTAEVVVFGADGQQRERTTRAVARTGAVDPIAALIVEVLQGPAPPVAALEAPAATTLPAASLPASGDPAATRSRPWYRRWWVWTIAGAAAAGVAVAIAVSAGDEDPPPAPAIRDDLFDFTVTFGP